MNALLMGYYGARNLGDEMMLLCLRKWLHAQNVRLTVLSERALDIQARHGLPAVENLPLLGQWSWREAWLRGKAAALITTLARHDALVVGGGDLIRDDRGWRNFLFSVEKIVAALVLRRPVYLVNIGIGTPSTSYGRRVLRWMLPRCDRIIARDERTVRLCAELGAGEVTDFAPDIVLALPALVDHPVCAVPGARRYALVCLRTHANDFSQFAWNDDRIATFAGGLDHLVDEHDLDIVFLPFQALDRTQDDNRIHERVAARMRRGGRADIRDWTDDIREVLGVVSAAECVIAMRLHAAVLACATHRRCVLMPYDHKVVEFGRQMGLTAQITSDTLERPADLRTLLDDALKSLVAPLAHGATGCWATLTLARADAGQPATVACP